MDEGCGWPLGPLQSTIATCPVLVVPPRHVEAEGVAHHDRRTVALHGDVQLRRAEGVVLRDPRGRVDQGEIAGHAGHRDRGLRRAAGVGPRAGLRCGWRA